MKARRWVRRALLGLAGVLALLLLAAAGGGLWIRGRLRASLPQLDGEARIARLHGDVRIERDRLGVPRIEAGDRADVARGLGFLHGQERFFQMDLLRRSAAGELAELFGPAALAADRRVRMHRFRERARRVVDELPHERRAVLDAYTGGVASGLGALGAPPPEYLPLEPPAEWLPEDSILVVYAMFLDLQGDEGRRESDLGLMHELLPEELVRFLVPAGTSWDAPLVGEPLATPAPPGPEVFRVRARAAAARGAREATEAAPGSNNWAIAGSRTADGGALLANDMHLGLALPNIWYRASLAWTDAGGERRAVTGATLPGAPMVVVGSNGRVAWGLTNSQGDWADLVVVETVAGDEDRYVAPGGSLEFDRHRETIRVRGAQDDILDVRETIWGPLIDRDRAGRPRALRWVAHEPEATNLGLLELETAGDVDAALDAAVRCGVPALNVVVADAAGRIGWTMMGRIPRRAGFDGRLPSSWADGSRRWDGWLAAAEYPRIVDPPSGILWTANNRTVDGPALERLGDGGYALGARAMQIRDRLAALDRATVGDMLALQLDDRALFLARWRELLLELLDETALEGKPRRQELRRRVEADRDGRASVDSVGYRMVRAFRLTLAERLFDAITAPCRREDPEFRYLRLAQWEGPLWELVTRRPEHLLPADRTDWRGLLLAATDDVLATFLAPGETDLGARTWGQRNRVRLRHPFGLAVPQLAHWLDAPPRSLPGDSQMPRVQTPSFGASQRMAVSPGRERDGYFHMPGGQSGHPLSPYYLAGHREWEDGLPLPFLPGPAEHTLALRP